MLVAFIAVVKYRDQNPGADRSFLLCAIVLGAVLLLTFNPISSARYLFGTAALAVAALFGLFATRGRFRVVALLAVAALVLVFPLADAFRYSTSAQFKTSSPLESLTSPDYDAFAQVNNTVNFVNTHGVTDGKQALGVVLSGFRGPSGPAKLRTRASCSRRAATTRSRTFLLRCGPSCSSTVGGSR
ncbi:hypothetical protein ACETU7_12215 [Rhodococcus sp. 3Y1]